MVDVRSLVEQAVEVVTRATEPLTQAAADTADAGNAAAQQGMQVTQAVAAALVTTLRTLPDKLRDIELPSAKQRLDDIADQLRKIAERLRRLGHHLGQASKHLGDPSLQNSGQLLVDGIDAAIAGVAFLRPAPEGLIRLIPRTVRQPFLDGIGTVHVGLSAWGDLMRLFVSSWPSLSSGLSDISEDLVRSASLLDATAGTLRELSDLSPI